MQYCLALKGQKPSSVHYLNKLGRLSSKAFLILEKIFKCFYHIWARRPSYLTDCDHFYEYFQSPFDRRLNMKFEKQIGPEVLEEKSFKGVDGRMDG